MAHLTVSTKGLNKVACRQLPEIKFQKTQPESDCQGERFNTKSAMGDYWGLRMNRNPPDEDYYGANF